MDKSYNFKFSFKKLLITEVVIYISLVLIILMLGFVAITLKDVSYENKLSFLIMGGIGLVIFIVLGYVNIIKLVKFINSYDSKRLKDLEGKLSSSLFVCGDWFITNDYIFYLKDFVFIEYDEITKISKNTKINFMRKHLRFDYEIILHGKDDKKYIYNSPSSLDSNDFISAITLVKPSILID